MASTGTESDARTPADRAERLHTADRVRVVSRADGDGLAAAAIYGRALASRNVPRHLSLSPRREGAAPHLEAPGVTVAPGFDAHGTPEESAALTAYETALEFGADPDPLLAIAGAVAADVRPHGPALEAARERGAEPRPGLGVPTAELPTGLAYSTRIHAPFSGDPAAAAAFLEDLTVSELGDDEAHRELAAAVALEATDGAPGERAVPALERFLAPTRAPGEFETIEGYADVLDAAARFDPGAGLAALLGTVDRDRLLEVWEAYGAKLHEAIGALPESAESTVTATVEAIPPVEVARLGHAFRVPADHLAVAGQETVALAAAETDARTVLRSAADGRVTGDETLAVLHGDVDPQTVLTEVEE